MWRKDIAYKNIWGCQINTWLALVLAFCIYTCVCTISKGIGINKEKNMSSKQGIFKLS